MVIITIIIIIIIITGITEYRVQSCTYWAVTELGGDHELGGDCRGSFVHRPDVLTPGWRRVCPYRVEPLAVEGVCVRHVVFMVRHRDSQWHSSYGSGVSIISIAVVTAWNCHRGHIG